MTCVATFIPIVAAPPATMLLYGPSIPALLTSSVLAALLCSPTATWLTATIGTPLGLPGVVSNVTAMALTGFVIFIVLRELPWITKQDIPQNRGTLSPVEDVTTPLWFVRRVLAEFSEAPFYGNEVASLFIFAASPGHHPVPRPQCQRSRGDASRHRAVAVYLGGRGRAALREQIR